MGVALIPRPSPGAGGKERVFGMGEYKPDADARSRLDAVDALVDEDRLVEVACNDESPRVRLVAVSKIQDDQRLLRIAEQAPEIDVRLVAVERMSSQQLIAGLLKDPKNLELIGMCFSRISDRDVIESIAQDTSYSSIARRLAVEHYADEGYLAEVSDGAGRKSEAAVEAFLRAYGGGLTGVRAIGRFKRSEKALRALGTIAQKGGEAGGLAVEYLCGALASANPKLTQVATEELSSLQDADSVASLVRAADDPKLSQSIRKVLEEIGTPAAHAALGKD